MSDANRNFKCLDCGHKLEEARGGGRSSACPECGSKRIYRVPEEKGCVRPGRDHRGPLEI